MFKGVVEFPDTATSVPVNKAGENSPSKTKRTSPLEVFSKSPVAKKHKSTSDPKPSDQESSTGKKSG